MGEKTRRMTAVTDTKLFCISSSWRSNQGAVLVAAKLLGFRDSPAGPAKMGRNNDAPL